MFGFSGGDSAAALERKRAYLIDAQEHWPFLTNYDASTIKVPQQLITMVKERSSCSHAEAEKDVRDWMTGKDFEVSEGAPHDRT